MIAAVIGHGGVVVNRVIVDELLTSPFMVDGTDLNIGDIWPGAVQLDVKQDIQKEPTE